MKDYIAVAGQLGVTHLLSFTQTHVGVNMVDLIHQCLCSDAVTGHCAAPARPDAALPHPLGLTLVHSTIQFHLAHTALQYWLHRDLQQNTPHPRAVKPVLFNQAPLVGLIG